MNKNGEKISKEKLCSKSLVIWTIKCWWGYQNFGLKIEEKDDRLGKISILEAVLTSSSKKLKIEFLWHAELGSSVLEIILDSQYKIGSDVEKRRKYWSVEDGKFWNYLVKQKSKKKHNKKMD